MDLLYSGYIESKIIQKKNNLMVFQPNNPTFENYQKLLPKLLDNRI